ncbi:hypothetical protein [Coleofasciculus sp. FACHB-SPT9]|nr:hypothetical protein [Coleofasciculus sp. FACHB-SPT9]
MSCELGVTVLTCNGYQIFLFYKCWLEEMRSRFAVEVEECDRVVPLPATQARSLPPILPMQNPHYGRRGKNNT